MKAVRIHEYGGREALSYEDAPMPVISENDLLVRVHATTVNPIDWKIRSGYLTGMFNFTLPWILGMDVSGVVEAVGAQVTNFSVGDEVFGQADITRPGSYADYIAITAANVALKPRSLSHTEAAAIPQAGLTAWNALVVSAGVSAGQTVLIHGAAGGVGSYAVQIAKCRGARVIGTASGNHLDFLRELGADMVIEYPVTHFEDVVHDVDIILDTVGGETLQRSYSVLKKGGMLVSVVEPPSAETAADHGVQECFASAFVMPGVLAELARLVDDGKIKPYISMVLPLSEIQKAHALSESMHVTGKIVVQVEN